MYFLHEITFFILMKIVYIILISLNNFNYFLYYMNIIDITGINSKRFSESHFDEKNILPLSKE